MNQTITPQHSIDESNSKIDGNISKCTAEDNPKPLDSPNAQGIFDERFRLFIDEFGDTCERENVKTAMAIVVDPKLSNQPIVFLRGNEYEIAQLLASMLRKLQQEIMNKIAT